MTFLRALSIAALALILNVVISTQGTHAAPTASNFTGFSWPVYTAPGSHLASPVHTNLVTPNQFIDYNPLYSIYAYDAYCQGGGSTCVADCGLTSPGYSGCAPTLAAVYALGPTPYATFGAPGFIFMGCAVPQPSGGYLASYVLVATPAFIQMETGYLPNYTELATAGTNGKGTLLTAQQAGDDPLDSPPGSETLTQSTSSLQTSAYDIITGNVGSVQGVQSTDNTVDQPQNGYFKITINGYMYNTYTNNVQRGTLTCNAGGPHAMDVANYLSSYTPYPPQLFAGAQGEMEDIPYFNTFTSDIFPNGQS